MESPTCSTESASSTLIPSTTCTSTTNEPNTPSTSSTTQRSSNSFFDKLFAKKMKTESDTSNQIANSNKENEKEVLITIDD